ncbi:hypothetical protein CE91St19_17520 [Odoribacter laneus]|jgi:hypothetical protein|nr:hypothetical protein CE91St19_17520 [Odoribacter laneus]GKI24793.1 hypothetical protein CE91St20_09300 [Odoribacter laneus]
MISHLDFYKRQLPKLKKLLKIVYISVLRFEISPLLKAKKAEMKQKDS